MLLSWISRLLLMRLIFRSEYHTFPSHVQKDPVSAMCLLWATFIMPLTDSSASMTPSISHPTETLAMSLCFVRLWFSNIQNIYTWLLHRGASPVRLWLSVLFATQLPYAGIVNIDLYRMLEEVYPKHLVQGCLRRRIGSKAKRAVDQTGGEPFVRYIIPIFKASKIAGRSWVARHENDMSDWNTSLKKFLRGYDRADGVCPQMLRKGIKSAGATDELNGRYGPTAGWLTVRLLAAWSTKKI